VIDEANDLAELLERAADARALAGRRLEQRDHFVIRLRRVDPIERSRSLFDSCARTRAHVRAWMQHDCGEAEALSAMEVVDYGGDRFAMKLRVRRGEIDEIRRVREDRLE